MILASSSLRLARESASSSVAGRALSCEAERLCLKWGSPKVCTLASSRAKQHNTQAGVRMKLNSHCRRDCAIVLPSAGAERDRWPSSRRGVEKGSPKQLVHKTASIMHRLSPAVIWNAQNRQQCVY